MMSKSKTVAEGGDNQALLNEEEVNTLSKQRSQNETELNGESETLKPPNLLTMYVQCRNLPNLDNMSKTDPFVKCYIREEKKPDWQYIGETEMQ